MIENQVALHTERQPHPSLEELESFGHGTCDDCRMEWIGQHVLHCSLCCEILSGLPDDKLLSRLAMETRLRENTLQRDTNLDVKLSRGDTDAGFDAHFDSRLAVDSEALIADHPKYDLIRKIGSGGMGEVFLATHRFMNRPVALKLISSRMMQSREARLRFQREVQIAAKLSHPNIVAAFDAHEVGDQLVLVSEYFDGESLESSIDRGDLSVADACDIARQVALGLSHAHASGLVHRDIKPQNILISPGGHVKVVDFGLAQYTESDSTRPQGLTSVGVIVGTPDYISPEQAHERRVDHRADIYSLGCTLYHLITGMPPFTSGSRIEKLAHHIRTQPVSLATLRPDVSPELDACVAKMLQKDPDQRFQSAGEVANCLVRFCLPTVKIPPPSSEFLLGSELLPNSELLPSAGLRFLGNRRFANRLAFMTGLVLAFVVFAYALFVSLSAPEGKVQSPPAAETGDFVDVPTSVDSDESIPDELPGGGPLRVLAIVPPEPLMRDVDLFYKALEDLPVDYLVTATSCVGSIPYFHDVKPLEQIDPSRFHATVFFGPDTIDPTELADQAARLQLERIIDSMDSNGRPVASFGTGLWTLAHTNAIQGRAVARCDHSTAEMKRASGAQWSASETVVIDENFITGTHPTDATEFVQRLFEMIVAKRH